MIIHISLQNASCSLT